jgi:threonine/homoserine/homoserine lactone efflux protein
MLLLSAVFKAMTFVVFVIYGFVAHAIRRLVIESARVQRWLRYRFCRCLCRVGGPAGAE